MTTNLPDIAWQTILENPKPCTLSCKCGQRLFGVSITYRSTTVNMQKFIRVMSNHQKTNAYKQSDLLGVFW